MKHLEVFVKQLPDGKFHAFINYDFEGTKGIIAATDAKGSGPVFETEEDAWKWLQERERNGARFLTPEEADDKALQEEIYKFESDPEVLFI